MEADNKEQTTDSEEQIEVGLFRPADAKGIVDLFRAVYGEGYPIKVFYDEKGLTDANVDGEYYSIVARTQAGKVVGVQHLYRSAPYKSLYEVGAGLVLKEYRQFGVNKRMLQFVFDEWVPESRHYRAHIRGGCLQSSAHAKSCVADLPTLRPPWKWR